jgi:hypothetical protein
MGAAVSFELSRRSILPAVAHHPPWGSNRFFSDPLFWVEGDKSRKVEKSKSRFATFSSLRPLRLFDPFDSQTLSATTGLRSTPRPSISTSTVLPGSKYTGGLRAKPTPGGVPVKIKSPEASVHTSEM